MTTFDINSGTEPDAEDADPRVRSYPVEELANVIPSAPLRGIARPTDGGPALARRRRSGYIGLTIAADALAVVLSVGFGISLLFWLGVLGNMGTRTELLAAPLLLLSFCLHGMYRGNGLRLVPTGLPVFTSVARSTPLAMLAMIGMFLVFGWHLQFGWLFGATALLILPCLLTVPALRSGVAVTAGRLSGSTQQRVLVIGAGEVADHVVKRLRRHGMITPIGMVDDDPLPGFDTIGTLADVPRLCREERVDRIIVALPRAPWLEVSEILQPLIRSVDIAVVPSLYELMTWRSGMDDLAGMPLIPLVPAQKNAPAAWIKRGIDLVLGLMVLLVTLPILLATAVAIKVTSPGPVFFQQRRAGRDGTSFSIWKFRTMDVDAEARQADLALLSEADGPRFKMAHDPRVTRVGTFLRRFSIDELPQVFNVLAGTMSLVGPRPFPLAEAETFYTGPTIARFQMNPGMTGLWQVSGRSDLSWDDLCRLDAIYVGSWSLMWDLRILLQTPVAVLRRRGAY